MNKIYSHKSFELKAKDVALHSIFELLPINFCWINREGHLLGCNHNLIEFLGINSFADIIGKDISIIGTSTAWENTQKVLATGKSLIFEEEHTKIDGSKVYFLSIKSPLKSCEGEIIGITNISIDITDRKQMEIVLNKAKEEAEAASIAKSEFLQNMQHDLRTPFCGILSVSQFLASNETDSFKKEFLKDIELSSTSLLNLLNEILEYSKESLNTNHSEDPLDVHYLLGDIHYLMTPELKVKNLYFNLFISNMPSNMMGDTPRIKRILINVIANAIKFTNEGRIRVSANCLPISDTNGEIEFIIEDTGIGIPEDKLEYIFQRFTKLSPSYKGLYDGSGLGLAIVKEFVEVIEGRYEMKSQLGKGSIFKMWVPYTVKVS